MAKAMEQAEQENEKKIAEQNYCSSGCKRSCSVGSCTVHRQVPPASSSPSAAPLQPTAKYGSHLVSLGGMASGSNNSEKSSSHSVTTSIPLVRMFMGIDRKNDKKQYESGELDANSSTSVTLSKQQFEDESVPRVNSAFGAIR